jgi:hypothetical protein
MKIALSIAVLLATVSGASAQYYGQRNNSFGGYGTGSNPNSTYHQGYTTNSGTYVQPHYQTRSNNTQYDNYGMRGNVNPYTGAVGTRTPRW